MCSNATRIHCGIQVTLDRIWRLRCGSRKHSLYYCTSTIWLNLKFMVNSNPIICSRNLDSSDQMTDFQWKICTRIVWYVTMFVQWTQKNACVFVTLACYKLTLCLGCDLNSSSRKGTKTLNQTMAVISWTVNAWNWFFLYLIAYMFMSCSKHTTWQNVLILFIFSFFLSSLPPAGRRPGRALCLCAR